MSVGKASKAELIKRREEIRELIIMGKKRSIIVDEMSTKWNTSKRAIQEDIRIIAQKWENKEPELVKKSRNKYLERLEHMFEKALASDNLKAALDIQKEINKLSGLYSEKEEDAEQTGPTFIKIGKKPNLKAVDGGN